MQVDAFIKIPFARHSVNLGNIASANHLQHRLNAVGVVVGHGVFVGSHPLDSLVGVGAVGPVGISGKQRHHDGIVYKRLATQGVALVDIGKLALETLDEGALYVRCKGNAGGVGIGFLVVECAGIVGEDDAQVITMVHVPLVGGFIVAVIA